MMPIAQNSMINAYVTGTVNHDVPTAIGFVRPEALLNRQFILKKLDGLEVTTLFGQPGHIAFEKSFKFNGFDNSFVSFKYFSKIDNQMNGEATYYINNGLLKWDSCASTFVASSDTEHVFKEVFSDGAYVLIENNQLILRSAGHELIFE